jgi:hypothetical protein
VNNEILRTDIRRLRYSLSVQAAYLNMVRMLVPGVEDVESKDVTSGFLKLRKHYRVLRSFEREAGRRGIKVALWASRSYVETILERGGPDPASLRLGGTL